MNGYQTRNENTNVVQSNKAVENGRKISEMSENAHENTQVTLPINNCGPDDGPTPADSSEITGSWCDCTRLESVSSCFLISSVFWWFIPLFEISADFSNDRQMLLAVSFVFVILSHVVFCEFRSCFCSPQRRSLFLTIFWLYASIFRDYCSSRLQQTFQVIFKYFDDVHLSFWIFGIFQTVYGAN